MTTTPLPPPERAGDLDHIARPDFAVRLGRLPVDVHLAALARPLRLRPRLERQATSSQTSRRTGVRDFFPQVSTWDRCRRSSIGAPARPLAPCLWEPVEKSPVPLHYSDDLTHPPGSCCCVAGAGGRAGAAQATAARVTTPQQEFGHNFGDDYFLANYKQLAAYWHKLDNESDRMTLAVDRQDRRGARSADGDRHVAGEPPEPREVPGHLAPARARRGAHRRAGARAREGRQGHRLDRRRPARQRDARRPAARRDGLPDGQPHRRRDDADPGRRDHPVRARQPGRQRSGRRLVHAQSRTRRNDRPAACRGCTRSTSATTTTATSSPRRSPRPRT